MDWLQKLQLRLRALFQKQKLDAHMDDEMRSHIEMQTQENIEAGMNPEDARYTALRQFGWVESVKERCREQRGVTWIENLAQDIRYGTRSLFKNPGFTIVTVLTLAIGIGANTAIFTVVNTVILNPLAGPEPDRVVQIAERDYETGGFREDEKRRLFNGVSPPVLEALAANQQFFSDFIWVDGAQFDRKTDDFTEVVFGAAVPPNFFSFFDALPVLGRTFAKDEATPLIDGRTPARNTVVVISYSWWKSHFGGDPAAIGRTIQMGGSHFTVVGVMPSRFRYPTGGTQFWFPSEPARLPPGNVTGANTSVFARLKPEVTLQQVNAMLEIVAQRLKSDNGPVARGYLEEWQRRPGGLGFWVRPARERFTQGHEDLQRTFFGLLTAVGFVLLIVCANVANLTLARAEKRQQELAVRAALGAGRLRLVRLLLTESLLLGSAGGLLGLTVAMAGIKLLTGLIPEYMARMREIQLDGLMLGFTLLVSVAASFVFGCAPAWCAARDQMGEALKRAGLNATGSVAWKRYRNGLVIAEIALTLVLLTGAGLMIQSVARLLAVNPGFDPENLVRVYLSLPGLKYDDPEPGATELRRSLYAQMHERLAALPGVKAVGIGKHGAWPEKLKIEGRDVQGEVLLDGCGVEESDLFRASRIPLRAGRYLDKSDLNEACGNVIINETMARRFWPGKEAVGKKFDGIVWRGQHGYQVVGVVGDLRDYSYNQTLRPTFYRPCQELQLTGQRPFLLIRTEHDPRHLIPAIRAELKAAEPEMRRPDIVVCRQVLYESTQAQRLYMLYLAVFAGMALLLSALGIYGVLAYSVARRTREIGIRMAIGAERRHVLGMVMREGARLVGLGMGVGLLAAFWLTRLLRNQLFEVSPTEPVVFLSMIFLLLAVGLLACFLPARRAGQVEPIVALRYE